MQQNTINCPQQFLLWRPTGRGKYVRKTKITNDFVIGKFKNYIIKAT